MESVLVQKVKENKKVFYLWSHVLATKLTFKRGTLDLWL